MEWDVEEKLKRLCAEHPKLWETYLPAVLCAYREAKQESLGFSTFELMYGHTVSYCMGAQCRF